MKGILIAMEGGEATGKSTQCELLYNRIDREYLVQVELVTEPSPLVRELVTQRKIQDLTRLYLIAAGRTETHLGFVEPALENGSVVITDRYLLSTLVYQFRYYSAAFDAHFHATNDRKEDMSIILDLDVVIARSRLTRKLDVLEDVPIEVWEKRRSLFKAWAEHMKHVKVVDALGDRDEVHERVWALVEPLLKEKIEKGEVA